MTKPLHHRLWTTFRHRWNDDRSAQAVFPADAMERLREHVRASERRHTGQIRICVERSLPTSYLWRHLRQRVPMGTLVHQRALMMFAKLRVWDTERNNGVLIYLLLAECTIEFVADRGLTAHVPHAAWQDMVAHLSKALAAAQFEAGLAQAIDEVTAPLAQFFPRTVAPTAKNNELPDTPVVG
jgi:hypothetical protein